MFNKALILYFLFKTAVVTCNYESRMEGFEKERMKIQKIGVMNEYVNESSGICKAPWSENLLSINDSGGKPEVYEVTPKGKLVKAHTIPDAKNVDWEEITTDTKGNLYIGDFGNNSSQRKDLCVYKFDGKKTEKINFSYANQGYGEKKEFDCEAFFWYNQSLYLFTKSWEKGLKVSRLYVLPDDPGNYILSPTSEIHLDAQVTGAAINPSQNKFALISYGKLLTFHIKNDGVNFNHPQYCIKTGRLQTEAVMYLDDENIIFTNEQRRIYKFEI